MLFLACGHKSNEVEVENTGYAQGTTFQIKYLAESGTDYSSEIKGLFLQIDNSMNTYIPNSLISKINQGDVWVQVDTLFLSVLNRSVEVAKETDGEFDPTVGPLVELWGFGLSKKHLVTQAQVDSVKQLIGYPKIEREGRKIRIPKGSKLDFNAIAQGFTVDVIAEFLEEKGTKNYMVEVGGEVRARGKNKAGNTWKIGIDKPTETIDQTDRFQIIIALQDASLATSGNYRKFWVDENTGIKYAHTIDPKTGFPAKNKLLSASVITANTMDADVYATACMVKGLDECYSYLSGKENVDAYLVYTDEDGNWKTRYTEGFNKYIAN